MWNWELYHHGIKGMKWGVRRYQNKDGSLTAAGKKRYDREVEGLNDAQRSQYRPSANKWAKDDLSRSRRLVDETATMANKLKTANDQAIKKQPKSKLDLSEMSDKELRDQINRAMLEKQYNDMFAPQTVNTGRERANEFLETAGTVLAIGSSALGIALAIKELRG